MLWDKVLPSEVFLNELKLYSKPSNQKKLSHNNILICETKPVYENQTICLC